MWRSLASNMLTILVVAALGVAGLIGWGQQQYVSEGPLAEPVCLQVPSGSTMARVAANLSEIGAISNETVYKVGSDYSGKNPRLKAGSFLIDEGASMAEIVDEITGDGVSTCGTQIVYRVSVNRQFKQVRSLDTETQKFEIVAEFDPATEEAPAEYVEALDEVGTELSVVFAEGVTSWQVVNALNTSDWFEGDVPEIPAEGSLAPDGYDVRVGTVRSELLKAMEDAQSIRLREAWDARADDAPVETPEEALILASIIEKETGVADERPLVASVFANRLRQGIKLQTDPTVIYGITKGEGILGRGIRQSELRRETPWNTYVIDGLPPTPIANPGKASIEAALSPAESDYIFFVADGTGGHAFAVTLDEHNANVAKWREIEAERANQ
ncbi:MAG: endolytic transglycosylase MltG [Silicimonas sp.]|nr:endolytic transglycosylase MltG [Silicimonas sp.]